MLFLILFFLYCHSHDTFLRCLKERDIDLSNMQQVKTLSDVPNLITIKSDKYHREGIVIL